MSRARLGLFVFCRRSLFEQCYELQPTFQLLLKRPDRLALNLNEISSYTERHVEDTGPIHLVSGIDEMSSIIKSTAEKYKQNGFIPRVEEKITREYSSFRFALDSATVKVGIQASRELDLPGQTEIGGGGSDANIFNANGLEIAIAGTGMSKVHTVNEFRI